jgi:GDPmannose 4,6-dehydratase
LGLESCLFLGNLDALRDWGHAKDYVRMQWMMLQQDHPDDFVIATGQQMSVRRFVLMAAAYAGITLEFSGEGQSEIAIATRADSNLAPGVNPGDVVVRVDPRYFRPAEVESLLGNASKAKQVLGWEPQISVEQMCAEMVECDLVTARQHALLKAHGHSVRISIER